MGGGVALEPHLGQLKRLEFIYERIDPEKPRYVFVHALTHEVAYEGLLLSRRRALHEAVGQMLERQYADRLDEVVDLLAHHYSRTERSGKAVEYLSRSAEKAVRAMRMPRPPRLSRRPFPTPSGCPAEGRESRVLALVVRLVSSLYYRRRAVEDCRDLLISYRPRVDALGDPRLAGEFYFWLGQIYGTVGDSTGSERFAMHAIEEAGRAGDGTTIGKARIMLAWEGFFTGRYAEGAEHARAAVDALEATEEWWWLGYALGWEAVNRDEPRRLRRRARAGRDVAGRSGASRQDPRLQSYGAWMRGRIRAMRGDWEAAIADLSESLERSPEPLNSAYAMGWLGFTHREKGDTIGPSRFSSSRSRR